MQANPVSVVPYDLVGGEAVVRQIVDRFYDYMDELPEARPLRDIHAPDLAPMRQKLFEFMSGWLGGPPLYFKRPDAKCMGSAHQPFAIDAALRDQWMLCMSRALDEVSMAADLRQKIERALQQMTEAMRNR